MKNRELIDRFKQAHGLAYDLDLAFVFGLSKQQLSDWVNDKRPIPMPVKFRLLSLIGYPNADEFAALFVDSKEHADAVKKDRRAIANVKAMAVKAIDLAEDDRRERESPKKRRSAS